MRSYFGGGLVVLANISIGVNPNMLFSWWVLSSSGCNLQGYDWQRYKDISGLLFSLFWYMLLCLCFMRILFGILALRFWWVLGNIVWNGIRIYKEDLRWPLQDVLKGYMFLDLGKRKTCCVGCISALAYQSASSPNFIASDIDMLLYGPK